MKGKARIGSGSFSKNQDCSHGTRRGRIVLTDKRLGTLLYVDFRLRSRDEGRTMDPWAFRREDQNETQKAGQKRNTRTRARTLILAR